MRKKWIKTIIIIVFLVLIQFMAVYVGLAIYYKNAFEYGTWINGIYCTGKSIDEVNEELVGQFQYDGITIYDKNQNSYFISAQDIVYQFDFKEALKIYLGQQNSWLWIDSFWKVRKDNLTPVVSFDKAQMDACMEQIPFLLEGKQEDRKVAIIKTNQGYELLNERTEVLNVDEAKQAILQAVENSETEISLEEASCYHDLEMTPQMQETMKQ